MTQRHTEAEPWGDALPDDLQQLLRQESPLPDELVDDIWSGTQKKIAAGVVVAGALAIATAAAKTTAPTTAGISALLAGTVVKVVVGGMIVVGAIGGAVAVTRSASTVATHRVAVTTVEPIAVPQVGAPVVAPPIEALPTQVPPTAAPIRAPKPVPVAVAPAEAAAPDPHTVKAELLLLDQARAALDRGDADAALVAIAKQRALSGVHGKDEEAAALEVMATARVDVPRAKKLRDRFVLHYPDSKLQQRVDRSVGE